MTALNQLVRMSAESLLNCMLEGIAIGLFAWILLRLVGRRNSSTRFAVWFFALVAIAALPVLSVAASSARAGSAGSAITVPSSWALVIFSVWATIAGVALFRVGVGLWQLRKLRASCTPIEVATLDPVLQETLRAFQSVRSVTLCQSASLKVPTAIGFLKPVVVLPPWALQDLSTAELNSILIHELTHLRRRDDWTNLAQQILKALLFFHPAVWWIENKLALEREMACDDAVLAETANPRGYAECLISVAEKSFMRRGVALAQAAVNRVRQTSLRVTQILDVKRSRAIPVWKPALYSVAAFFVACLVSLSHAPELIAFKDQPETLASASTAGVTLAELNAFAKQAVVTPASFHGREGMASAMPQSDQGEGAGSAEPRNAPAAEQPLQARGVREGTASAMPHNDQGEGATSVALQANNPAAQRYRKARHGSAGEQAGEDQNPAGATLDPEPTAKVLDTRFTQPDDQQTQPAIFVIMETRYVEAGPMLWQISVWHVTVLDRVPEIRIPTKQI
jgi:beta-lactamase regulating signal transducer with metallopeptidase domain